MIKKGDRFVRLNSTHRVNGVDLPCVYQVTSVRSGKVFVVPTWQTPVECRPVGHLIEGRTIANTDTWLERPFADRFVPEI